MTNHVTYFCDRLTELAFYLLNNIIICILFLIWPIFEIDIMKNSSPLNLTFTFFAIDAACGCIVPCYIRRVLLVCHKNKWRDLSQKFVTSLGFFIEGDKKTDKKTFLLVENIFWTNENVFLSPFNKQKQRSAKFLWQITSLIFVTD